MNAPTGSRPDLAAGSRPDGPTDGAAAREVAASAPGKLILLGEYAVLDGAPTLVAAVGRRARAVLTPACGSSCRIDAPDLGLAATWRPGPRGAPVWEARAPGDGRLGLVTAVLRDLAERAEPPAFDAALDTSAFFGEAGAKLGLGSSAALTVALTGALHRWAGLPAPALADLVRCHRAMQGGRGSGADVAAALHGGLIEYSGGDGDRPAAEAVTLPEPVRWCCVWTGRSTSTPEYLRRLADWRVGNPRAYATRMGELADTSAAGLAAVRRGDAAALLAAFSAYGTQLGDLGAACGADIVGAEHRQIGQVAARCGAVYKPSGAGGGDVGLALAVDAGPMEAFRREIERLGYCEVGAEVDPRGLTVRDD